MSRKTERFLRFLTSGKFENPEDAAGMDEMIRYVILNVALIIGAVFLTIFGITVFLDGNVLRAFFDFLVAFVCVAGFVLLRTRIPFIWPAMMPIVSFTVLCGMLIFSGGVNGFAGLWIYALPPIAIFVLGARIGSVLSLTLLAALAASTFLPNAASFDYRPAIALRLCGVYILVFTLTFAYERIRLNKDRWVKQLTLRLEDERRKAESAAAAKSSFLANMSHEIRTPMNAILGMIELILRKDISAEVYEDAVSIKQAGVNLRSIINDILDFSKIESGKLDIVSARYTFSSLINDVVSIIRMRMAEKPVSFVTNIDSRLPNAMEGDVVRLRQILLNLLSNSVKYTREGFIALTVQEDTRGTLPAGQIMISFQISDTGVGIKEEDMGKLFGEFSQVDIQRNQGIEGTGLGLAISRNLCRLMGGDIAVESRYGQGSSFTAVLPQKVADSRPLAEVEDREAKPVLVYEQRRSIADSLEVSLKNLGVPVTVAHDSSGFYWELEKGYSDEKKYAFAFVPAISAEKTLTLIKALGLCTQPVMMAEMGEIASLQNFPVISMPAYALSIANVLNGRQAVSYHEKTKVAFIAPRAKILIVDDIITNLNVAKGLLALYQMDIQVCTSGRDAIDLVRENPYDIIFMDHMMPEMDGIEAVALIREMGEEFQKIPIVALTANAIAGMREMFLENGFDDYLAKPIEIVKLNTIIERWIPKDKQEKIVARTGFAGTPPPREGFTLKIPGLDTAKGINMTGGTEAGFRRVLSSWLRDAESRLERFHALPGENELGDIAIQAHALKGASATIGADALSAEAAALEAAGKSGDMAAVRGRLPGFYEHLRDMTQAVRAAFEERYAEEGGVPAELSASCLALLKALKEALEKENIQTIDSALKELGEKPFDLKTRESIDAIFDQVLISEFDGAASIIDELLAPRK
ncbi:MAG: response regulator [Spirochaetales bacterium]|jgi:signal transduction histidine kinase/CheY-like chemotaxis protein|nr:response regulator [Spirochaetales bacterium]